MKFIIKESKEKWTTESKIVKFFFSIISLRKIYKR